MDNEEILMESTKLINVIGPVGEQIFDLAIAYNRIDMFAKLRLLIQQKDLAGDQTAVDILNWAYLLLSE